MINLQVMMLKLLKKILKDGYVKYCQMAALAKMNAKLLSFKWSLLRILRYIFQHQGFCESMFWWKLMENE